MSGNVINSLKPLYASLKIAGVLAFTIDKNGNVAPDDNTMKLTTIAGATLYLITLVIYTVACSVFSHNALVNVLEKIYITAIFWKVIASSIARNVYKKKSLRVWKALINLEKDCLNTNVTLNHKRIKYSAPAIIFVQCACKFFILVRTSRSITVSGVLYLAYLLSCDVWLSATRAEYATLISITQDCFRGLNKTVVNFKVNGGPIVTSRCANVRTLQKFYAKLCELSRCIVEVFTPQIIAILTENVTVFAIHFYFLCAKFYDSKNADPYYMPIENSIYWIIDSSISLSCIIVPSYMCMRNANKIKSSVGNIDIHTSHPVERNIKLFSLQILLEDFKISPGGLFVLDLKLCYAVIGAVVTYITIIVQFDVMYFK